jgi:excisionase family DNA binding protein
MTTKVKQSPPAIEPERMYSYEEVAAFAGVSPRMVKRWCEDGRLGFVRLPRGRRILGRQYAAFVTQNVVEPE